MLHRVSRGAHRAVRVRSGSKENNLKLTSMEKTLVRIYHSIVDNPTHENQLKQAYLKNVENGNITMPYRRFCIEMARIHIQWQIQNERNHGISHLKS